MEGACVVVGTITNGVPATDLNCHLHQCRVSSLCLTMVMMNNNAAEVKHGANRQTVQTERGSESGCP